MNENQTVDIELDPEDIILLFILINKDLLGRNALRGITRLEKLLFLLQRETDFEGIGTFYHFQPHNFGPFSKEVYEAIDFLESCELIKIKEQIYTSHFANMGEYLLLKEISESDVTNGICSDDLDTTEKIFSLTKDGTIVAKKIQQAIEKRNPSDIEALRTIVRRFASLPLTQLIRYVYSKHTDMITKSIHPEAKRIRPDSL